MTKPEQFDTDLNFKMFSEDKKRLDKLAKRSGLTCASMGRMIILNFLNNPSELKINTEVSQE